MSTLATTLPARRAWRTLLRVKLALWDRRKYARVVLETIDDMTLVVPPDVFNPVLLRSGAFLVSQVRRIPSGARVLDMGCGSGAVGITAARRGCQVVAVDINPSAVRCARANALLNAVEIDIRQGDLFAPVTEERFDVVLFNPPYYRGEPRDDLDHAWRSPDVPERFASQLGAHLTATGYALVILSSDGEPSDFLGALQASGLRHTLVAQRDFVNEVMSVYEVTRAC
jgi:release factor glutamine methyltransferase